MNWRLTNVSRVRVGTMEPVQMDWTTSCVHVYPDTQVAKPYSEIINNSSSSNHNFTAQICYYVN